MLYHYGPLLRTFTITVHCIILIYNENFHSPNEKLVVKEQLNKVTKTRSSVIAEVPHDTLCQLKSSQPLHNCTSITTCDLRKTFTVNKTLKITHHTRFWFACKQLMHDTLSEIFNTRMRANAQRDGRPAEYRWRALFNAAKFGWRPLLQCRAVTLQRRESRRNLQGWPKLATDLSR